MLSAPAAMLALMLVPVHGVVLDARADGSSAIVRTEPASKTIAAGTRDYRLVPATHLPRGTGVDGYVDASTRPWTLREPTIAAPFAPGTPDTASVLPVDAGARLPDAELVDQNGRLVRLDRAFLGKTTLISFVFTRCPDRDLCPAISGKFAYLQQHLDPSKFALVLISLDPPYDSPRVMRDYGATFGANPAIWSLLTGKGSVVQRLLNEFGIDSMRVSSDRFIHSDKLFIVTPQGKVGYVIQTAGWDPDGVLAEAQAVGGMAANPFERFKLSLVASVVAICGGSQYAGVVFLELALFFLIFAIVVASLWVVGRVLWHRG